MKSTDDPAFVAHKKRLESEPEFRVRLTGGLDALRKALNDADLADYSIYIEDVPRSWTGVSPP